MAWSCDIPAFGRKSGLEMIFSINCTAMNCMVCFGCSSPLLYDSASLLTKVCSGSIYFPMSLTLSLYSNLLTGDGRKPTVPNGLELIVLHGRGGVVTTGYSDSGVGSWGFPCDSPYRLTLIK